MKKTVATTTIETFARSIYKEASQYGFDQVDVIKLINRLMDLCNTDVVSELETEKRDTSYLESLSASPVSLPVSDGEICIREYRQSTDECLLASWLPERYGRYFLLSGATAQKITVAGLTTAPGNHLGIVTLTDGTAIGAMAYLDHSKELRRAELRKLIGNPEYRGRGLAEKATKLWVHYGIACLGLEKIYVSTLQTQIANIRLNERIGFEVEGLLRNEVLIDGERHDVLRMGLCVS